MATADQNTFGRGELRALLVAPSADLVQALRNSPAINQSLYVLASFDQYPAPNAMEIRLRQLEPDFVLVDIAADLDAASELIRSLSARKPATRAVAVGRSAGSEAVVGALRAGACEFLNLPFDSQETADALARLHRLRPASTQPSAGGAGKIIVFASAKSGAGSSTVATHLAHALRREHSRRVLLADLDTDAGTAAFYLKLAPSGTVRDLLSPDALPADWARVVCDSHGLDVLAAPETPQTTPIDPEALGRLLAQAAGRYEWVIVDAPNIFQPSALMAISESHLAFLVTTPDLASLHVTKRAITLLAQLGLTKDRYRIVVNRMSRRDEISQQDIERMFHAEVYGVIPNEYFSIHRAISLGQPIGGEGELGRSIAALAKKIKNTGEAPKTKPATAEQELAGVRK